MSGLKIAILTIITLLVSLLLCVPAGRCDYTCKDAQNRTNAQAYSRSAGGNSQFKQSFMPAMGGGGGMAGMGQNQKTISENSMHFNGSERTGKWQPGTATVDNHPAQEENLQDNDSQQMVSAPHDLTAGMTGAGAQYMGPSMASTMPRVQDYASGGFFDGLTSDDTSANWFVGNDKGGRGSGGGGGGPQGNGQQANGQQGNDQQGNGQQGGLPFGSFPLGTGQQGNGQQGNGQQGNGQQGNGQQGNGQQGSLPLGSFPLGNGQQGNGQQGNGQQRHGPLGNGPGAQMYYENHMPGHTPQRPNSPLALPGVYNFSGPGTTPTHPFSSSVPGMNTFLPFCCQKNLPCCQLNLRCCAQKNNQNKNQNQSGGGGGGGGGGTLGGETGGNVATGGSAAMAGAMAAQFGLEMAMDAAGTMHQAKSNGSQKQGSGGGSKGEGAMEEMNDSFSMMLDYLINVANENAGSPTSAESVSKTYQNAVWMVQQMYKNVYMQIAILLVLPGALLTNIKSIVGFNFLNLKDEDTLSPFTGIQRAIIAVFLIPATQLFVSYVIDTANALSGAVSQQVNVSSIETWAQEQIQTFEASQQGEMIKNLPIVPRAPWRGKAASMPKTLGMLEQMSYCDIALTEAINQCVMALSIAAIVFNVFQITFMCYLYLMGPICAAFFAWPGVGRELFRKAFSSWMDGVVILALWKFWWDIVLLCWGVWIDNSGGNPYELVNGYYCIGWMCLLMFVPFNPFDFKVGEIVSTVLAKAESAAAAGAKKGAQGAKKGGGGGGGGPGPGPSSGPG